MIVDPRDGTSLSDVVFDLNPIPMWVYDSETLRFLSVNDAAVTAYGYARAQFLTMSLLDIRPAEEHPLFAAWAATRDVTKALRSTGRWKHLRADGSVIHVDVANSIEIVFWGRPAILAIAFDVTERNERIRALEAFNDPATGLPNRAALFENVEQSGFPFGGLVLVRMTWVTEAAHRSQEARVQIAQAIVSRLRALAPDDAMIFRYTEHVFAVLTRKGERSRAPVSLARKIAVAFERPVLVGSDDHVVIPTIGVAAAAGSGCTIAELARQADAAVHEADRRHDRIAFYTDELGNAHDRRATIERHLRQAIAAQRVDVVYQPIVSLTTGKVVGAEALMRWECPGIGAVRPAEFIPIAESGGMIVRLGEWILRAACLEARQWQIAGFAGIRIAVNVSARQVEQRDFVRIVVSACASVGLPLPDLEIEITERVIMQGDGIALRNLEALRRLGVRVSIDDFGTGYSALSYLASLPLDTLKLDGVFIIAVDEDPFQAKIAASVITLARERGLTVVAEGVETEAQRDWLRGTGCDEAQGYLFGRPAAGADFRAALARG